MLKKVFISIFFIIICKNSAYSQFAYSDAVELSKKLDKYGKFKSTFENPGDSKKIAVYLKILRNYVSQRKTSLIQACF